MTIERVGFPDPISRFNKAEKAHKTTRNEGKDSISFSEGAKQKAEIYNATETVKMASDVRLEKLEEIKRKLEDPNYITEKVIEDLAEKLMDHFNI